MDIQHENVANIVKDYDGYLDFIAGYKDYSLEYFSYTKWSVGEILKQLEDQGALPPLVVIENFRDKISEYSQVNPDTKLIFSAALKTAEDIIDLLL